MSLVLSAKLNEHDPLDNLKDVLTRLPTQPNGCVGELLPHLWTYMDAPGLPSSA